MGKPWFKAYTKKILEGDSSELTNEQFGLWMRLLAICADYDMDGRTQKERGIIPLTTRQLSRRLGQGVSDVERMLDYFEAQEMLTKNDGGIHITNWGYYQPSRQEMWRYKIKEGDREGGDDSDEARRKGQKRDKNETFETYVEQTLKPRYPDLDVDEELEKCQAYFSEQRRQVKSWKLTFANWLKTAREIKQKNQNQGQQGPKEW